ncbi:MAG: SRPBCC domain-containing protein [Ilumatobacteraceae bacterium]
MTDAPTLDVVRRGEDEIVIVRALAAPRTLVYEAYTTPALLERWLGPRTWELATCDLDVRVGGAFRYEMHGPDGAVMTWSGTYREVDPPTRLVTTEVFDDDWTGGGTINTVDLTEHVVGGVVTTTVTTTVRYSSSAARDAALSTGMSAGMAEGYRRLDDLLAAMGGAS